MVIPGPGDIETIEVFEVKDAVHFRILVCVTGILPARQRWTPTLDSIGGNIFLGFVGGGIFLGNILGLSRCIPQIP